MQHLINFSATPKTVPKESSVYFGYSLLYNSEQYGKASSHVSVRDNKSTSVSTTILYSTSGFIQGRTEDMSSDFCFSCRIVVLKRTFNSPFRICEHLE